MVPQQIWRQVSTVRRPTIRLQLEQKIHKCSFVLMNALQKGTSTSTVVNRVRSLKVGLVEKFRNRYDRAVLAGWLQAEGLNFCIIIHFNNFNLKF